MSPVRETSIEAFQAVMESGYVGRRQKEVYAALYEHGPCTGSELYHAMTSRLRNNTSQHANTVTRLGELRDRGLVEELQKRICRVTGHAAYLWKTTDAKPKKFLKPDTIKCPTCKGKGRIQQGRLL